MTVVLERLPVTERARMIRELDSLMRDTRYRTLPIGRDVARFLSHLRWTGSPQTTVDAYEGVLSKFAVAFADYESLERFATGEEARELLMWFLDGRWGAMSTATKARNTAAVRSFFKWAEDNGRATVNPAAMLKAPRVRNQERTAYDRDTILRLINAQPTLRDQCALQLLGRMALRKDELRQVRVRDIDLIRNLLTVHGKGGKIAVLPIAFESVATDLFLHLHETERHPDEYLLYARNRRLEPMDKATVHRWFKRCLDRADLPASIQMHELRHSAADDLWRATGNIVLAQKLLRHESVGTTQRYLHPTREDLAAGMRVTDELWSKG